jgi:hypothetical protein
MVKPVIMIYQILTIRTDSFYYFKRFVISVVMRIHSFDDSGQIKTMYSNKYINTVNPHYNTLIGRTTTE